MLLSKIVKIKWHHTNKNWYENRGYKFTKINNEFECNIKDLQKGSNVLVNVQCDGENCKNSVLKPMTWVTYLKSVKENGKYYCKKCANELYGKENIRLTKLKNSKSFEQWCIENDHQDILDRWDYELNDFKPSEISYSTHKNCYFKCQKEIHESELKNLHSFTQGNTSLICLKCNSFAQWGIDNIGEDFLEKYWDYEKNTVDPWVTSKRSSTKKVWIKCQEKDYHGSYDITPAHFTEGKRCPFCINHKVHYLDSLGKLLENKRLLYLWSEKNKDKSPYKYAPMNNNEVVWWKCHNGIHNDYKRTIINSNNSSFNCPDCTREEDESMLQKKIRLYLNELKYSILHEFNCTLKCINPKTKRQLPYDNEIKELKLIIETQGRQHYQKNEKIYDLHQRKLYDRYKRMYAKSKGYFYLEIPFNSDNKKLSWKKLIDNKIGEILLLNN